MKRHSFVVAAAFALLTLQRGTAGVTDYEVITNTTVQNSDGVKSLLVNCPAGKQLLGGGARIFGSINDIGLTASGPEGPPATPTGWFGTATEVVHSTIAGWAREPEYGDGAYLAGLPEPLRRAVGRTIEALAGG